MNTIIYLIRHGITDYNEQNRYCGTIDEPINENGRKQAELLKHDFKGIKVHSVYSSVFKRATQTAGIVFPGMEIIEAKGMREMNFGEWEGKTFNEISGDYGDIAEKWFNNATEVHPPGGESLQDMSKRVLEAFASIMVKCKGKTIAITTHGGPIAIILCTLKNHGFDKLWDMIPPHATATEIHINNKGGIARIISPGEKK